MDPVSSYAFGNLGWLSLQALPLIVWPSFITSLLRDEYQPTSVPPDTLTPAALETYYARSLGFSLLALGLTVLLLSGALPLAATDASHPEGTASPYADAAVSVSALHHATSAFYCYSRWLHTGQTASVMGCLGSGVFAVFGLWFVMFAGSKGRHSKRTGFDKDTSGFPFKNSEAYRKKKKGL
ncbi:hypothetical protein ACHAQF_006568 [Verticillium nonalfalfae]